MDNTPHITRHYPAKKNIFCYIYIRLTLLDSHIFINNFENGNTVFGRLSSIID